MHRGTTSLAAAVLLAVLCGCASGGSAADDDPGAAPSPSPSDSAPSSSPTPGEPSESPTEDRVRGTEITVSVHDGEVSPQPRRVEVERDTRVRLVVTSDVADELHVHGFDVVARLAAGRPATVEFVADQSGVFEVETHESGLELLQLAVR